MKNILIPILLFSLIMCSTPKESTYDLLIIGTYTKKEGHVDGKGEGLSVNKIREEQLDIQGVAKLDNPTFIDISSTGNTIYIANETGPEIDSSGSVSAYRIEVDGNLIHLSTQSSGTGPGAFYPCHIVVDPKDRLVITSNYAGGVTVLPIGDDNELLPPTQTLFFEGKGTHPRQDSSHPHSTTISPDGNYAYVIDLGTDKIMMFSIDYKSNKLTPLDTSYLMLEPEAGPRHMTFHNTLNKAYVINELNNTITILDYNGSTGILKASNSVTTLPDNFTGDSHTADIHITDDGKFLYGTNRGHNSIAIFEISNDGSLLSLGHEPTRGDHPRNFLINKNELYVANQNTDNVVVFEILSDGKLKFKYELNTNTPVCLRIIEVEG